MNFVSAAGLMPTTTGWHRIWLHTNDPLISLECAIGNNDEHFIISTGCMVKELNQNKLELTGSVGNSTHIDILVMRPSGKNK